MHGETLADNTGTEPLYETLRSWVQGASPGLTSACFQAEETDEGQSWLVEQLTPTLAGFGPFELRVFVLGGVATCVVFDELEDADDPLEFTMWREYQCSGDGDVGRWSATSWGSPSLESAPLREHEHRRRFVDRLVREFLPDLARDAEALAKAAGACLLFRADFFLFPAGGDVGCSWALDEYAEREHSTDLRSTFSYRVNEMQYWLGNLVYSLEEPHVTFVLEALKALLTEFEGHSSSGASPVGSDSSR
jgi:hypothetical protein